jgi:hypothetical protein
MAGSDIKTLGNCVAVKQAETEQREAKKPQPPAPFKPFPLHLLPPVLEKFVYHAARSIGCDPAFIALPVLVVVAGMVGATRTIKLKDDWCEPAIVWGAVIADSGTLKTPAVRPVMRPVYKLQVELGREHEDELKRWKENHRDDEKAPTGKKVVCSDVTVEKVADLLERNPRGLLLYRNELAGWFASFTRNRPRGGSDVQSWLEMFGLETLIVDRKGTGKPGERNSLYIPHAAVSVVGTIQPGIFRRAMTDEALETGLAARILVVMPPKKRKRWTDLCIAPDVADGYEQLIRHLYEKLTLGKDEPPVALPLTAEARQAWQKFYNAWAEVQESAGEVLTAAYAKLEGYAARFALLHCLVSNVDADRVGVESVNAGVALAKWFAGETQRVYATLAETAEQRDARQLVEFVQGKGVVTGPNDPLTLGLGQYDPGSITVCQLAPSDFFSRFLGPSVAPTGSSGAPAINF